SAIPMPERDFFARFTSLDGPQGSAYKALVNHSFSAQPRLQPPAAGPTDREGPSVMKPRRKSDGPGRRAPVDKGRVEAAVREILLAVGEDPDREGLQETPARVARMYAEMFAGLGQDPRDLLKKTFTQKYDEMVLVKNIHFESVCEHHLLPFLGNAHVAYLAKGN